MTTVLSCQGLSVSLLLQERYYPVLRDLNFELKQGETFAIVGESGCGKSMTALALTQLLPPTAMYHRHSAIYLGQKDLLCFSQAQMQKVRGRGIGMIFQEPMTALNPVLTVGEQVFEILSIHGAIPHRQIKQRVLELLQQVGIPDPNHCYSQYPHQLSGGMKQRIVIAMAIALEPQILIADEPTTALDVTIQAQILELLQQLQQQQGMAILLISHNFGVISQVADKVAVMYAGEFIEEGFTHTLMDDPKHPYTQQLLAAIPSLEVNHKALALIPGRVPSLTENKMPCAFASRCSYAWDLCRTTIPLSYEMKPHHLVKCHLYETGNTVLNSIKSVDMRRGAPHDESIALDIQRLACHFPIKKGIFQRTVGVIKAVDGIDLQLKKGKTLALVGESGCGKTTLGKAIALLLKPTAGEIYLNEDLIFSSSMQKIEKLRKTLQMIFQDPFSSLNPRRAISQILCEGLKAHKLVKNKLARRQRLKNLLEQVGLPEESLHRYPHEFSGGQRQRISIARALAVNPSILICDEPTSALDLSVQAKILNLLKELQTTEQLSYLFITHDISVVGYMADDVAVMYLGRIVEKGCVKEILTSPKHPYTQALLAAVPVIGTARKKESHYKESNLLQ